MRGACCCDKVIGAGRKVNGALYQQVTAPSALPSEAVNVYARHELPAGWDEASKASSRNATLCLYKQAATHESSAPSLDPREQAEVTAGSSDRLRSCSTKEPRVQTKTSALPALPHGVLHLPWGAPILLRKGNPGCCGGIIPMGGQSVMIREPPR